MVIHGRLGRCDWLRDFNCRRTFILLLGIFLHLGLSRIAGHKSHLACGFDEEPTDTLLESSEGCWSGWGFLKDSWLDHRGIRLLGNWRRWCSGMIAQISV